MICSQTAAKKMQSNTRVVLDYAIKAQHPVAVSASVFDGRLCSVQLAFAGTAVIDLDHEGK